MFEKIFDRHDWAVIKNGIYNKTAADVERALSRSIRDLEDFKALISPAAAGYLEEMARESQRLTQRRFGKVIQLYIPLYLSNECQNICTYCGFSYDNPMRRKTLGAVELLDEIEVIKSMGFEHVLLVSGEANKTVGVDYFIKALRLVRPHFANISMEVQPLDQTDYETLIGEGLHTVLVYQETYHRDDYKLHHPKGKKSNFGYRLETPDRLGKAGIYKMGLGTLIGLEDWRTDSWFTAFHLQYLEKTYWRTKYSLSFPRLRPHAGEKNRPGSLQPKIVMTDRELIQLICAYRLLDEEVELSLSTREHPLLRDHAIQLGITAMSAGSRTNPGGYTSAPDSLEQFEIHDDRSPAEVASMVRSAGYEPIWKDWF